MAVCVVDLATENSVAAVRRLLQRGSTMRTSNDGLQCSLCSSRIRVELSFPTWIQKATLYVEKIAAAEGWDLETRTCPMHERKAK